MKPLYGNIDEAQYIKELEARCCLAVEKIERLSCENERLKGEGELADKVIADFSCEGKTAYAAGFCDADPNATHTEAMKCYEAWQKERVSEEPAPLHDAENPTNMDMLFKAAKDVRD